MAEVQFPLYRTYIAARTEANNAMTAMLAGSRLAAHTLQLTTGSKRTLSELFPTVEHIRRLNLRSDRARSLLDNADHHLASVALPYALATHEHFVLSSIELLRDDGVAIGCKASELKAWSMHETLFEAAGHPMPEKWLEIFHLLRKMRNCIIHAGGYSQPALDNHIQGMSEESIEEWQELNDQLHSGVVQSNRVILTAEHILTGFAVTKRLGREVNSALVRKLNKSSWARIAVEDFQDTTSKVKNSPNWRRALNGYTRQYYSPIELSDADLESASRKSGNWSIESWG
ncbi:hypothetical protein [Natronoglycomyces albus]|uniref:Uncharacterized protein n=1 Tax=Natronoglycomyces albus TaxID=2811108 RepID=A0A895XNU8_9ACTN|nr:hypothetical protein [Natronoglycomyces albus]QSB03970.1 hypothetical protein JQS30_09040 [Natronoglycomyces albus]